MVARQVLSGGQIDAPMFVKGPYVCRPQFWGLVMVFCAGWLGLRTRQGRAAPGGRASSYEVTPQQVGCARERPANRSKASRMRQPISGPGRPRECASARGGAQVGVDLAGDVALEAADDLRLGFSFARAVLDVGAGGRVRAHAGEYDAPQGVAGLAVAARVEPVRTVLPDDAGMGAAAHMCAQAASLRSRSG